MHLLKLNVGQITFTKLNTNKAEIQRKPNHQISRQPYRHKGSKLMQDQTTQSTKQSTNQPKKQIKCNIYSIFVVDLALTNNIVTIAKYQHCLTIYYYLQQ